MSQNYSLRYEPILEHSSGDLAVGGVTAFQKREGVVSVFTSPEEAVSDWVSAMTNRRIDLMELPQRRGFGLVFSASPRDGAESFLYNIEVYGCDFGSTD